MSRFPIVFVAVLLVALVPACGTSGMPSNGTVTVMIAETPAEEAAFQNDLLTPFDRLDHGDAQMRHATRALDQELQSDLQTGTQPDVAILPSPGEVAAFARQGALLPLDGDIQRGRSDPQWLSLENAVRQPGKKTYAVPIKMGLKSAVWYDPTALGRLLDASWSVPRTWRQLLDLTNLIAAKGGTPWCIGMESPPVSGWPGTDWIEDILLHQSGAATFEQWVDGKLSWRSPAVEQAFQTWQSIVGNQKYVGARPLLQGFDMSTSLFAARPTCYLYHAAFLSDAFAKPRSNVDFFPFPAINGQGGVEVSGDFAVLLRDTPQARKLIDFLASDAQDLLPAIPETSAFPVENVSGNSYPNSLKQRIADVLTHAGTLCFDASDLMPPALTDAFYHAILSYLSKPTDQGSLDDSLAELDTVQANTDDTLSYRCGR